MASDSILRRTECRRHEFEATDDAKSTVLTYNPDPGRSRCLELPTKPGIRSNHSYPLSYRYRGYNARELPEDECQLNRNSMRSSSAQA
jgi:hypothetical protein